MLPSNSAITPDEGAESSSAAAAVVAGSAMSVIAVAIRARRSRGGFMWFGPFLGVLGIRQGAGRPPPTITVRASANGVAMPHSNPGGKSSAS